MESDRGILDTEKTLKGDQAQDIGKPIFPKNDDNLSIARQMRGELHCALNLIKDHARQPNSSGQHASSLPGMNDQTHHNAVNDVREELC